MIRAAPLQSRIKTIDGLFCATQAIDL